MNRFLMASPSQGFLSKIQRFLQIKGRGGEVWISFLQGARGGHLARWAPSRSLSMELVGTEPQ